VLGIIHRMILWELIKIFLLSLVGITGILLMAGIVAEANQQGLTPGQILTIIPFLIPSTLPYTIPATTLFATCLVYGRLAHDNEILVIRAAGVSVLQVVTPAVLLGVIVSTITMGLYYRIIPYSHHLMRTVFLGDVEELMYMALQRDHQLNHPKLGYALFVREIQGRKLIDPVFKHRSNKGEYDLICWPHEAELRVDMVNKVLLVKMLDGDGLNPGDSGTNFHFKERIEKVPLPPGVLDERPRKPRDLSWQEILSKRRDVRKEIDSIDNEFALYLAPDIIDRPPQSDVNQHLQNLDEKKKAKRFELNCLTAELQMRPALAVGCLFFVLVGCPIGIWFSKSDHLSAFITCFLPIVIVYYPLLLCGTGLAKDGKVLPFLGVWMANGVMLLASLLLYRKLTRH
jgi:lipopolysaccharide export system permease protein